MILFNDLSTDWGPASFGSGHSPLLFWVGKWDLQHRQPLVLLLPSLTTSSEKREDDMWKWTSTYRLNVEVEVEDNYYLSFETPPDSHGPGHLCLGLSCHRESMPSGNTLIDQLRDRAVADLEVAKLVLPSGDIPQVAWSVEQAYEKILQSTYCYYKIKGQGQGTEQIYAKLPPKYHTKKYQFILNMLEEFYDALGLTAARLLGPEYTAAHSLWSSQKSWVTFLGRLSPKRGRERSR